MEHIRWKVGLAFALRIVSKYQHLHSFDPWEKVRSYYGPLRYTKPKRITFEMAQKVPPRTCLCRADA